MLKMMFLVHPPADKDIDEARQYWRETHAPIAAKIPGLAKYVQKHFLTEAEGSPPQYLGVAEMWFRDESSFGTPEFDAAVADTPNFLDPGRSPGFNVEEVQVVGRSDEDVVRRFFRLMDTHQFDELVSVLAPNLQFHLGNATLNRDELTAMIRDFYSAFPDWTHSVEEIFAGGGRVVARATDTATHLGEFNGIAATQREISVGQIAIYAIDSGHIVEVWEQADAASLMEQISSE